MAEAREQSIARAFLDAFVAAFATFDGARVADLFAAPYLALSSKGELVLLPTRADVERYYQAALDSYQRNACRSARWSELDVAPMGSRAMLVTATWELLDGEGQVRRRWRQSYSLQLAPERAAVFASASHAD